MLTQMKTFRTSRFSIFLLLLLTVSCQKKKDDAIHIKDFSPNYEGVIVYTSSLINNEISEQEKFANIAILDIKSGDTLVNVPAIINPEVDIPNIDSIQSNQKNSPFGAQSLIIFDDFNCDGYKDLAIKTGNNSCYGSPSYNIYLGDKKGKFEFNQEFTTLAQQFCGIFKYDCETETVETFKKEGSIWNQFQTYKLVKGLPELQKQVIFDNLYYPISIMEETTWVNKIATVRKQVGGDQIRAKEIGTIFFHDEEEQETNKVLLFESLEQDTATLYLFWVDQDNYIEQEYPLLQSIDSKVDKGNFILSNKGKKETLTFKDKNDRECTLMISPNNQSFMFQNPDSKEEFFSKNKSTLSLTQLLGEKDKKWTNVKIE